MSVFLGVDVGTSSVTAAITDENHVIIAHASAPLSVSRPRPGWSEQNPNDWLRATEACLDELAAAHGPAMAAVAGIGFSGQMHGATLLDAADKPLRPCILWNDGRASAQCRAFEAACPDTRKISGNLAMPGFTAPKLLWVRDNEPDVFAKTETVLLPKDYVRLFLTGEKISDMSDAAGTLWLDAARRTWSEPLLAASGLTTRHMPALAEGSAPAGRLRESLAKRWGMTGCPVTAGGGGDNAATACGLGAVKPGMGFVSIGTSGVLFVCNDRFSPNTKGAVHAFCHALPDTWHQMGVILSAAGSLEWLAGVLGADAGALVDELGEDLTIPSPLMFLPYLSGERTPHNDADVRGGFIGLDRAMDRAALTRAVLQGVAFAFRDCYEALGAAGTSIDRLLAAGGGSHSALWLRIIATLTGLTIEVPHASGIGAVVGGARLGRAAAGGGGNFDEIFAVPEIGGTIKPERGMMSAYQDAWERHRALYPLMRGVLST